MAADEPALIARLITRARRFGRYGSRRIMALLRAEGWRVNHKRVERLWRQEGLRVPPQAPAPRRSRPNPRLVRRLRQRTDARRSAPCGCATIVDEHTRACRSIAVARRRRSDGVLACRTALFVRHGPPSSRRSDHGPAFTATAVRSWLRRLGVTTRCIEPGSPWENGDGESFTGQRRRDECRNPEICTTPHRSPGPHRALAARVQPGAHAQRPRVPAARPGSAGDRTAPPHALGSPEGSRTNLARGTAIGGRSRPRRARSSHGGPRPRRSANAQGGGRRDTMRHVLPGASSGGRHDPGAHDGISAREGVPPRAAYFVPKRPTGIVLHPLD